jgi:hypothetical protein
MEQPPDQVDRHEAVTQYSLAQILGVWAAAAFPMGVLAWIVAPWLRDQGAMSHWVRPCSSCSPWGSSGNSYWS